MSSSLLNHINAGNLIVARLCQREILSPGLVHDVESKKGILTPEKLVKQAIKMLSKLLACLLAERLKVGKVKLPDFGDAEVRLSCKAEDTALLDLGGLRWSKGVKLLPVGEMKCLCELAGIKSDVVV